jgi:hypothetical protein
MAAKRFHLPEESTIQLFQGRHHRTPPSVSINEGLTSQPWIGGPVAALESLIQTKKGRRGAPKTYTPSLRIKWLMDSLHNPTTSLAELLGAYQTQEAAFRQGQGDKY